MSGEPQDQELTDDELDGVVGGVPHITTKDGCVIPVHGGCHYHGKKNQTSAMDDLADANGDITF